MTVRELLDQVFIHVMPSEDIKQLSQWGPALDISCQGVTHDSRSVRPGWVFVGVRGRKADGADFAPQAVAAGAAAVVSERAAASGSPVPWIVVEDARLALAWLAAEFFQHPSRQMRVVGITGTNGKTTTSYIVSAIFEAAEVRCGLMGTVKYRIGDREIAAARTTPEAPELQAMLREMVDADSGACAMEVSSHALSLRRADGIHSSSVLWFTENGAWPD